MNENLPPAGEIAAIPADHECKTRTRSKTGEPRAFDFRKMKGTDLGRATGVLREQWLRWVRENGCPQNADSTFSLPDCVRWLRQHAPHGASRYRLRLKKQIDEVFQRLS